MNWNAELLGQKVGCDGGEDLLGGQQRLGPLQDAHR